MTTTEKAEYYAETANRPVRPDLVFAISLIEDEKIAIDCGCGAGADIAYLRENGFFVFAFDIEAESIKLCSQRFAGDDKVSLSRHSFLSYDYPEASLVVADASLFFCPETEFGRVWVKIWRSLKPGGIFCGSFLGPDDTMASPHFDRDAYWPNILVFNEQALRSQLEGFEILRFKEHNVSAPTRLTAANRWHVFSVVARKPADQVPLPAQNW